MTKNDELNIKVKEANKIFYDNVIDIYEKVDGRRSDELLKWLDEKMRFLSETTTGGSLLDFGCGTGVIIRSAKKYFKKVYGIDVSPRMVEYIKQFCDEAYCSDGSSMPFNNESFDVVVCFSVLHHIYDYSNIFNEIYRVLKKGGFFYTDHDMDINFAERFRVFLKLHRIIFSSEKKYIKMKDCLTKEIYELSEIHSNGIDSDGILKQLKKIGFIDIKEQYHWFGLNRLTNLIIGHKTFKKGFAPLFSVLGKK